MAQGKHEKETPAVAHEPPPLRQTTSTPAQPPADLEDYEGKYTLQATGMEFGLKVDKDDPHGRTHKLKNETSYWEGTEDEFKKAFEKK